MDPRLRGDDDLRSAGFNVAGDIFQQAKKIAKMCADHSPLPGEGLGMRVLVKTP
jgi:hypothetical protein